MGLTNKQKSTIDLLLQYGYVSKSVDVRNTWERGEHANTYLPQGNFTANEVKRLVEFLVDGNDEIDTIKRIRL